MTCDCKTFENEAFFILAKVLYTEQLLNQLDQPRQEVGNMFRQVAYRFGQLHNGQHPEVLIQSVQPQHYYFSQSKHVEKLQTSDQYPFYIKTTPADAQVRILNIGPAYQAGMKLKQGQYKIEVTKAGYSRHISQFELTANNQVYHVELESGQSHILATLQTKPTSYYPRKIEVVDGRYTDHGDGTVTDSTTGLQWMRCSIGQIWKNNYCVGKGAEYTWQKALGKAEAVVYAGHSDWRVPTKDELESLIYCSSSQPNVWNDKGNGCEGDYQRPTIVSRVFPNTESSSFWSASLNAYFSNYAWGVGFGHGYSGNSNKDGAVYVRLVRTGQ